MFQYKLSEKYIPYVEGVEKSKWKKNKNVNKAGLFDSVARCGQFLLLFRPFLGRNEIQIQKTKNYDNYSLKRTIAAFSLFLFRNGINYISFHNTRNWQSFLIKNNYKFYNSGKYTYISLGENYDAIRRNCLR